MSLHHCHIEHPLWTIVMRLSTYTISPRIQGCVKVPFVGIKFLLRRNFTMEETFITVNLNLVKFGTHSTYTTLRSYKLTSVGNLICDVSGGPCPKREARRRRRRRLRRSPSWSARGRGGRATQSRRRSSGSSSGTASTSIRT